MQSTNKKYIFEIKFIFLRSNILILPLSLFCCEVKLIKTYFSSPHYIDSFPLIYPASISLVKSILKHQNNVLNLSKFKEKTSERHRCRVSTRSGKSGKWGKVMEFVRWSGNVRDIRDFLEKSQAKVREENFYPWNFLTSIKNHLHAKMCVVELYTTISSISDAIIYV